jgi:predicted dienelactone hydrolase
MRSTLRIIVACVIVLAATNASARGYLWGRKHPEERAKTPYSAGLRKGQIVDKVVGKPVRYLVWYPTEAKETVVHFGTIVFKAAHNTPPAQGSFALVAISHGTGGDEYHHHDTAIYLARRGYVVVVASHPEDNFTNHDNLERWRTWTGRPRQLSLVIDAILADKSLGGLIDQKRIAAIGYSIGGYTVLAAAGGKARPGALIEHCRRVAKVTVLCPEDGPLVRDDGTKLPPPDRRIRAVVALAPVAGFFDKNAFKDYHAKTLIYRAGDDEGLPYPHHAAWLKKIIPGALYRVANDGGGGHEIFLAPDPGNKEWEFLVHTAFHRRLNAEIFNYLEDALK